jgi:hypothetical protein
MRIIHVGESMIFMCKRHALYQGTDDFLETEEALLMKAARIILRSGAFLGSGPLS